jgi:hypothetical protein
MFSIPSRDVMLRMIFVAVLKATSDGAQQVVMGLLGL